MSNINLIPPKEWLAGLTADNVRRTTGGSICPTCRLSADLRIEHVCITRGGDDLDRLMIAATTQQWLRLGEQLAAHPAQPRQADRTFALRPVDSTWCYCACDTRPTPHTPRQVKP